MRPRACPSRVPYFCGHATPARPPHARPPPATCVPGTRPAPRFKSGGTHQTAVRRAPSPAAPRTAPRACSTRPARKENRTDLPTARPPDRPTSRPPDRPTTRPPDRPTARPPDRPTARPHVAKPHTPTTPTHTRSRHMHTHGAGQVGGWAWRWVVYAVRVHVAAASYVCAWAWSCGAVQCGAACGGPRFSGCDRRGA